MDINVHMAHTIRLASALMQANKRFDLMLIPGADHGLPFSLLCESYPVLFY